jgi:low affinity Fe/Cu permease
VSVKAWFDRLSCAVAAWVGHPFALVVTAVIVGSSFALWSVDTVNVGVSLFSLLLLFVLQASQNRDGAANQAKLDELIRAIPQAKNELRHLDEKTIDEVQRIRDSDD